MADYIPAVRLLFVGLVLALPLAAQSSPYIPLDHPVLPAAEYLITRSDIADPSPMIRPFRRSDLLRVIGHAGLDSASGRLAVRLVEAFADPKEAHWIRVAPRLSVDGFSRARRDLFHPAGAGGGPAVSRIELELQSGPLVMMSRAAAATQRTKSQVYRFIDAYLAGQWKHARLFFGQMERSWGPVGSTGLSIANQGYPRTDLAFEVVFRDLQFTALGTQLTAMHSNDGTIHQRYFVAHRLNARLSSRLNLALWETAVLSEPQPVFRTRLCQSPDPVFLPDPTGIKGRPQYHSRRRPVVAARPPRPAPGPSDDRRSVATKTRSGRHR